MPAYLTREMLHLYVWSNPLGKLSRKIGVPIDTLREACKTLAVYVPDLSYWMQLKLGAAPALALLPPSNGPVVFSLGAPIDQDALVRPRRSRHESLLSFEDVIILTGRKNKRHQCEALRSMKILFAENVMGEPLVPRSSVEGSTAAAKRDVEILQDSMEDALRRCK